eukprot:gene1384-1526_t
MASLKKVRLKTFKGKSKITCIRTGKVLKVARYSKPDDCCDSSPSTSACSSTTPDLCLEYDFDDGQSSSGVATFVDVDGNTINRSGLKSRYLMAKESEVKNWTAARPDLEKAYIENNSLSQDEPCSLCQEKPPSNNGAARDQRAQATCHDCGPGVFMCVECCLNFHQKRNKFHFLQKWEDGTFISLERPPIHLGICSAEHTCSGCSISNRMVKVVDAQGKQFDCIMEVCSCKPDAFFFVKQRLWPATSKLPRLAFTFEFMDLLESFFLESQVSVTSFCAAITLLTPPLMKLASNEKDILKALQGEAFEEYRLFKHNNSTLGSICEDRDKGTTCPACPSIEGNGCIVESIDACFGLVHKKAAGKYNFEPKFGTLKMIDANEIDTYINEYPRHKTASKDCNNFQAGAVGDKDTIYSKGKSLCYDIKGLIGSICRHDFPQKFIDLKHGERIGYSVYLIKKRVEGLNPNLTYCVLYDIACILRKHLQKSDIALLDKIIVGLPAFHSYAHIPSCQALLGTRRVPKIGLSDGEQCSVLPKRMEKAISVAQTCRSELNKLLLNVGVNDMAVLHEWIREEKENLTKIQADKTEQEESKYVAYVRALICNRQLRQKLMIDDSSQSEADIAASVQLLRRSEKELTRVEKSCGIKNRWTWKVDSAKKIAIEVVLDERQKVIESLRTLAHERKFLLKMKRLYANGQKLAKTLAISIGKKNKSISDILVPFNRTVSYLSKEIKELRGQAIDIEKAKDSSSDIYGNTLFEDTCVPAEVKQESIDLFFRLTRAEEEQELVRAEMANTIQFFKKEKEKVLRASTEFRGNSLYERGAISVLKKELKILVDVLFCLTQAFSSEMEVADSDDELEEGFESTDDLFQTEGDNDSEVNTEENDELYLFDY